MAYTMLYNGSTGEEVRRLQQALNSHGAGLDEDGVYGGNTEAAVRNYQRANGLSDDGIAGENTLGKLYAQPEAPAVTQQAAPAAPAQTPQQAATPAQQPASRGYDPNTDAAYQQALAALQAAQQNAPTYAGTYDQQLADIYQQIVGRDKFSYDINGDALYKQMAERYIAQGRLAMEDTMGQAAALTGGYGSSYGQAVGQQQYDAYLQQLNDNIPEYYQLALDRYNAEGDALREQYAMVGAMADDEYAKYQDAMNQYWQNISYLKGEADDAYNAGLQAEETAYGRQQDYYDRLVGLISSVGYTPSADELQRAGMSQNEADAYARYWAQQASGGSGGSAGGYGGEDQPIDDDPNAPDPSRYYNAIAREFEANEYGKYETFEARRSYLQYYRDNGLITQAEYNKLLHGAYGSTLSQLNTSGETFDNAVAQAAFDYYERNPNATADEINRYAEMIGLTGASKDTFKKYLMQAGY